MRVRATLAPALLAASLLGRTAHAGPGPGPEPGPEPLDDAGLAGVAAGLLDTYVIVQVIRVDNQNVSATNATGSSGASSSAVSDVTVNGVIDVSPSGGASPTDAVVRLPAAALATFAAGGRPAPASASAASTPPVWVPWAAELRPSLGLR
jgi:hypothetical protein